VWLITDCTYFVGMRLRGELQVRRKIRRYGKGEKDEKI
jgi:hypothetical protein